MGESGLGGYEFMSHDMKSMHLSAERILDKPIVYPGLDSTIGNNIQGPSAIRVPNWVNNKLGDFYLYFADHKGTYIRLAYADQIEGPWTIYTSGSLQLEHSHFLVKKPEATDDEVTSYLTQRSKVSKRRLPHDAVTEMTTPHIASPDVHVDNDAKQIVMYFHGLESAGSQFSRVATSIDGIEFQAQPQLLGRTYMRVFTYGGATYALAMPGQLYRSTDGYHDFEAGPMLFNPDMRHSAVYVRDDTLWVFWTRVGDVPERILFSTIRLQGNWEDWRESESIELMRPEYAWEGADAPLVESIRSTAYGHVNQLRDPAILEEGDRLFLFYAFAGEEGIGLVEIKSLS